MSFLEGIDGLADSIGSEGANAYARGAIIGWGARQGMSGRSTLTALRSAGFGIANGTFWDIWQGTQAQIAAGQTSAALPVDVTTGEILPGEPPEGWTGKYVHQVTGTYRYRAPSGETVVESRTVGLLSGQPLTPAEASAAAMDLFSTPSDEEGGTDLPDGSDMMTLQLTGAWYQVPQRRWA